ncbi:inositol -trisphosphate receptor-interacting 1 [Limosa lapponica baueri]|uniref:Inositol-trisphosphate receptor-interacting 1 n=1 Tax=Limosa lapponica baueri TaxID=1758121 RepID=A0A2I0UG72_LIMLA|nr:inositol -trisphosphate receptor-interacting 1 [Limosa lapponica baueri]
MNRLVQHLAQQLSWKMSQLLPDLEQAQDQNGVAGKVLLLPTFQQWFFWASALGAGALLLLLCLCWRTTKRSCDQGSICKQGSPRRHEEEEEEEEDNSDDSDDDSYDADDSDSDSDSDDDDSGGPLGLHSCVAHQIQWPGPFKAEMCKVVEDLAEELFTACQIVSRRNFNLRLQPPVGVGCVYEGLRGLEDNVLYRLFVPLQPPPGHVFCLQRGTMSERLTSTSCIRVQLQCMCTRELLVEDVLCFLHHSREELESQGPSLLQTLCTNSYLDVEKTTCWFQLLLKDAWKLMPVSRHCRLTVLPGTGSCKLRIRKGKETLKIEMILGVPLGDTGSFLRLD